MLRSHKNVLFSALLLFSVLWTAENAAVQQPQTKSFRCDGVCLWTHRYVVNGHPHGSMVIDLLGGDRFRLVSQKNAQQQQQPLVAVNHT